MISAPKPEEVVAQDVPSEDGEAAEKSEVETSSPSKGKNPDKVTFNGREYASLVDAEKDHKELQTAYQKLKAEKEELEKPKTEEPDDEFLKVLFGEEAPVPTTAPTPPPVPMVVDRDKVRISLLLAERDPKKKYFKDVANDVAKILTTDPMIVAVAGIGQTDKAVDLAYSKAVAGRIDTLKAVEYTRGREEALREAAKPLAVVGADDKVVPPPVQKSEADMTYEELEAILPHAEPRD